MLIDRRKRIEHIDAVREVRITRQIGDDRHIVVPAADKPEYEQRKQRGHHHGRKHAVHDGMMPGPVDKRRFRVRPADRLERAVQKDEIEAETAAARQ